MGFKSTLARCMRKDRLSKRLSATSTKVHDEDSNDLIKTTSETVSTRASMESTLTMVHHSFHEPVLPGESPANRMQIRTDSGNMRTLFDEDTTSNQPTDRATKALSRPAYPILKLDCRSPVDAPRRVLQEPWEMSTDGNRSKTPVIAGYPGKGASGFSSKTTAQEGLSPTEKVVAEKKDKRSMAALLKRHCGLNIPRSSISIKASRDLQSPKWLDSAGVTEEEALVDKQDGKWVEVDLHDERRRNSVWGGVALGRLW
ncbi:hypothetical protein DTO013E5_5394 [Penicillium roqueforti]|uniref:Uncharacterized protein n=1 Tax=Penicillium roqueforti (strain FM164) TaxID=1365484 RepID=W6QIQ5_PENRF|nr:uncharacterized protein LCP9604111_3486 [Penicillium roqueforti]CDM35881.1 hypothetical protein PROQFM164_S04g000762 [Penicillium roqueforti FM164]KAF9250584.1 hypothetical protein LCP9604111_3486 [Penicillium roqueforti]KAI2672636.1 hypothetical protein CBS147355_7963 [Penicillium roqueforti]KAI2678944.1 hypothetical protein LCP963914a_7523 [Penicillium roqueforti]KAI2698923.1 hypothetical protein CBS147372_6770 [Penicillium roqueforti]